MSVTFAILLLVGIGAGPYGLALMTPQLLGLLDPGIAVAAAMIGAFVGLSAASGDLSRKLPPVLLFGGALGVAAFRSDSLLAAIGLLMALSAVSAAIAIAGWFLVGETSSDGEQHAFVAGTLLLVGGAATYLSLSAAFAGFVAGVTWSRAGNLARARIVRDIDYSQHPFIVLALLVAGATAAISLEGLMVAGALAVPALLAFRLATRFAPRATADELSPVTPLGLVAIALALDVSRSDARPDWALTLLGATVMAAIASGLISFVRVRRA